MNLQLTNPVLFTIFETSKTFVGVFNYNNKVFEYINSSGLKLLKISNLIEFQKIYPFGFRKKPMEEVDRNEIFDFLKGNLVFEREELFFNHLNEEFWGVLQISKITLNNIDYHYINISDITVQKNTAQHEKDEENRFEALFMQAAIGIIMVDKSSKIILSNKFADKLFGFEHGELMNKQLDILIPQNLREKHKQTYENYTAKPKSRAMGVGLDLHGTKKDGTLFPVEISLSHFKFGEIPYYIAFINDVTFKKSAEENLILKNSEIQKLNESLEKEVINRTNALVETLKSLEKSKIDLEIALEKEKELGELKSRFVSMASHEFRTPLTAIQSAASLIDKYEHIEDQEKRVRHTNRIKGAVGNLTDILEEFLSVGRLEDGKVELKPSKFEISELINECIRDLSISLKSEQKIEYIHKGEDLIFLDKSLLRKIIINLGANAIKFSPAGSKIKINTETVSEKLYLDVEDSGIGISEDDQKYLYDRFFRGKNVTNIQGTGLGLHIVASYLELLNGSISVKSELGVGTIFKIKILLNKV